MSQSANANIFYGYCWEEEGQLIEGTDDWDEVIAEKRGFVDPYDSSPDKTVVGFYDLSYAKRNDLFDEWSKENEKEKEEWYKVRASIREEFGCEIRTHGYCEYGKPYIAVVGSVFSVEYGDMMDLTGIDHLPDSDRDKQLKKFVDEVGIDISEAKGPGWFLVVYWG